MTLTCSFAFKKALVPCLLLAAVFCTAPVLRAGPAPERPAALQEGILQTVENARVETSGHGLVLHRIHADAAMRLHFTNSEAIGLQREQGQWWVLPTKLAPAPVRVNDSLWVLPSDPHSQDHAWRLVLQGGEATAVQTDSGVDVLLNAASATLSRAEPRPHSDPFGNRFALHIEGGADLENALAAFYWGTMLPSVAEKTFAANFPYSSGYVLSTLDTKAYAGSYPAVDHEFQVKGRLAMGTEADLDIARRMIELQFRLMNDDPERLSRSPTSVQPDGRREYHIRRDSKDARENAAMFPLTANIEVVEESWLYFQARKDREWLRTNLDALENAAGWTLQSVDQYGRVWSDVYYEDQVIKDGRETEAQAFAAHSFEMLADMEDLLTRPDKAAYYRGRAKALIAALIAPLPMGYWDATHHRFVDWVDRNSQAHDHTALLANTLPVALGYATPAQADAVRGLVEANAAEFERFPSFVAADIAAYTPSEMGTAGPYDLSAAGRYWFWDAEFRSAQNQSGILLQQLRAVADEGRSSGYFMGERYDMDHVYYVDGKNAHGATKYYEYPNVYASVLINDYLGLHSAIRADVQVVPRLQGYGSVEFQTPAYALRYGWSARGFTLANLSDKPRSFDVDLGPLQPATSRYTLKGPAGSRSVRAHSTVTLAAQEEASWTAER